MKRLLTILSIGLIPFLSLFAKPKNPPKEKKRPKLCLNMIVKNESPVIRRCLDSVIPYIDYWVIVDTGSTDGTQKIIKSHLKGIPGELHEIPWKNFGDSRTDAIKLAIGKADYILFMDADDTLQISGDKKLPELTADLYMMWRGTEDFSYLKPQIVRGDLDMDWVGVTHEYLNVKQPYTSETLPNVRYVSGDGGHRSSDPRKFMENVKLLEDGLKKEPYNSRYMFYLGESYRDAGEKGKAIEWFQKRINMGGWEEEVYWSLLQIGHALRDLGLPANVVTEAYKNAHSYRPHRVESLYYLADVYNQNEEYEKAYEYIKARDFLPQPPVKDSLFNMDWIDEYGLLFQLSISAFYVGQYQEALDACDKLLKIKNLPEGWRSLAQSNRAYPLERLQKKDVAKAGKNAN